MVGPARKREAVEHLQRSLEMNERRAFKVVGRKRHHGHFWLLRDADCGLC